MLMSNDEEPLFALFILLLKLNGEVDELIVQRCLWLFPKQLVQVFQRGWNQELQIDASKDIRLCIYCNYSEHSLKFL